MERLLFILIRSVLLLAACLILGAAPGAAEADAANCRDHPLFTRMQNMHITWCKYAEFDRATFKTGKGTQTEVEGKRFDIKYQTDAGIVPPTPLAILRNHQQAIARIGGTVLYEDARYTWLKVAREGKEIWVQVDTAWMKGFRIREIPITFVDRRAGVSKIGAPGPS